MGCIGQDGRKDPARAGPSRRVDRNDQSSNLWFQQTECAQHVGNGEVRPTRNFGLQYAETGERMDNNTITVGEDIENRRSEVEKKSQFNEDWTKGKSKGNRKQEMQTFLSV